MKRYETLFALVSLLLLAACSETPKVAEKAKEPVKEPEPVTGRYAFHQMFGSARTWAVDVQALSLNSVSAVKVKSEPGKAGAWQATFVSPSRGAARTYTYSVIEAPGNLHKGVFAGIEERYTPRGQARPFNIQALKADSDEAYKAALEKSQDVVKKNPDLPISFVLELTGRFPNPAWRVVWGESVSRSNYSVFVDASTGKFLQKMR